MNSNKDPTDISCAMHLNMSNFILTIQYITISIFQGTLNACMIVKKHHAIASASLLTVLKVRRSLSNWEANPTPAYSLRIEIRKLLISVIVRKICTMKSEKWQLVIHPLPQLKLQERLFLVHNMSFHPSPSDHSINLSPIFLSIFSGS